MPFIPVPGVVQCNVRADYLGVPVENVLNFLTGENPVTPSLVQAIAEELSTQWVNEVLPELANTYLLREIHAVDLSSATGSLFTDTHSPTIPGGQVGNALPGNVAFCVSLRTPLRGRSFRGRIFFCGILENDVTGNVLVNGRDTALVNAIEAVRQNMVAVGGQLCVVSRFTNGAPRTTGIATPVTACVAVDSRVDTQRRRLS